MSIRKFGHRAVLALVVVTTSLWFAPSAFAHTHVGFGISVGVGNCWGCGYRATPPVYYQPVYSAPVYYYYPRRVYYGYSYGYPRALHYSYGYHAPYYRRGYYHQRNYRNHRGYYPRGYRGHGGWHHQRGRYHLHGHGHR